MDALQDGTLTPATRNAVGASLACRVYAERSQNHAKNWRGFTLSRWWADQSMGQADVKEILNNYGILDNDYPVQVQTPLGDKFDCWGTGMD